MDILNYSNNETLETLDKEDNKYLNIAREISKDIKCEKLTIVDAIEKLKCLLVNTSYAKREIGILILSEILQQIEVNRFNSEQLTILCLYYAEKLKDHHQVACSALKGVSVLINFPQLPTECVVQLVSSIFNHVTCQQQQQPDRYLIYQIYHTILNKYKNVVKDMGIDFVYGIISSINGERDPKNLMYLFSWIQLFLKSVNLGHLTEEMFDVLSCYFPIDFKTPPNDKNKITREDLSQCLCQCLTCISDFGDYSIPLALEKLDSTLKIAKDDSLDILKEGCKYYSAETYYAFSIEIWNQLQKDIFTTSDLELRQKSLETLKEIIKKLSTLEDDKKFKQIVCDVISSLKQNLSPDSKIFLQSSLILYYVAQACSVSSLLVVRIAGESLRSSYQIMTNFSDKVEQLKVYINFIKAAIQNNNDFTLEKVEELTNAPALCLDAVLKGDEKLCAEGFKGFIELAPFLKDDIKKVLFSRLQQYILIRQSEYLKTYIFACLEKMADNFPQEVDSHVLFKNSIMEFSTLDTYIESICNLTKMVYFEGYVVETLINYSQANIDSSKIVLKHLNVFLDKIDKLGKLLLDKSFITKLTDFIKNFTDCRDTDYLLNIKNVFIKLIRRQHLQIQQEIYYTESKKNYNSHRIYLVVLSGLITGLKKACFEDYNKIDFFINCSLETSDSFLQGVSVEILGHILNKLHQEIVLDETLTKISDLCTNCKNNNEALLVSWVVKGLLTRNHPKTWIWIDKLVNYLNGNINAAQYFKIIMMDTLKLDNNCNIMPLYKQKCFIYATNKISELNIINMPSYYNVIGYLLENAPKQAIIGQFKKILNLVFICLEHCTVPEILEIILSRLKELISSKETVIENNLDDILTRILDLTTFDCSMKVRILALQSLEELTKAYPIYKLVPSQQRVIKKLGACIDDKKRLVRKEATECRILWYLLDTPL